MILTVVLIEETLKNFAVPIAFKSDPRNVPARLTGLVRQPV